MAAAAGGQFEARSHGVLDLGWRRGPATVQLLTDTLDGRLEHRWAHGRAEAGLRVAAFAAGLWITPWTDGVPDPARAQIATYVGPDGRLERWLGGGAYVAATGWAHYHWFHPLGDATLAVADRPWLRGDGVVGWWRPEVEASLTAGVDATVPDEARVSPHLLAHLDWHPAWRIAPAVAGWAVWADHTDDVVATRVGGLTPYHVPLAGAAWAEWWVEDLVGGEGAAVVRPSEAVEARLLVDAVAATPPERTAIPDPAPVRAVGIGARTRWTRDRWFVEAAVGVAPGLRPSGPAAAAWLLAGSAWRPLGR
ncbi:MAG: hypothetical protein R3F59_04160 [Myxococcota bacterium]